MASIADFFRFWWSLLYWNAVKALFRRHRSGRCSCQSPSDSGRGGETRCEACVSWNKPSRFKRVCPLLVETSDGLMCSVDTAEVRPFWGIAAAWTGGSLAGLYVAAVLLAFIALRSLGFPVGIVNLSCPWRWHQLNEARAEYYFKKGTTSFAQGDLRAAGMSLYMAYHFDPRRYDVGLMIAEIATLAMPDRADAIYASLVANHPGRAEQTAQAWMQSALQRGDFVALRNIALQRLETEQAPKAPWLHALLFATRELGDADTLRRFAATKAGAPWHTLLTTEIDIRTGATDRAVSSLSSSWYPENPYNAYYQTETLLNLGHPREALITLAAYTNLLPGDEQAAVKLAALKLLGSTDDWRVQTRGMLATTPTSPSAVELFSEHLLRYPDTVFLGDVVSWLKRSPLPRGDASTRAYLALYCAAGACKDAPTLEWIASLLRTSSANRFYFLETVKRYFLDSDSRIKPPDFLPLLPLSLGMVYGIWERDTVRARNQAEQARKKATSGTSADGSLHEAGAGP